MGEVDEIVADNDSKHDEILDAAITYKTDGIYPSNLSKDWKKGNSKKSRAQTPLSDFTSSKENKVGRKNCLCMFNYMYI